MDLAKLEPSEVSWLWPGWIPRGYVSLATGDPDAGKTYALLSIAATVGQGSIFPDGTEAAPGRVLYLDGENGADEIKRRLLAQNFTAWECLRVMSEVRIDGRPVPFSLDTHFATFQETITNFRPDWIILDPLVAFHNRNEISATEVRRLLLDLFHLAQEHAIAVTIVQHPNKTFLAPDLYRVRGSLDFVAAVRAVLRVEPLKDREDDARALVVDKLNLARKPNALGFRIAERRVNWLGEVTLPKRESQEDRAARMLREALADGPKPVPTLQEAAGAWGIGWRTVQRAKDRLGILSRKFDVDGPWYWELPNQGCQSENIGALGGLGYKTGDDLASLDRNAVGLAPNPRMPTPAAFQTQGRQGCQTLGDDALPYGDDGRRKSALDLWDGLGCSPIAWRPGETIVDLDKWLSRASHEDVALVVATLEAMATP